MASRSSSCRRSTADSARSALSRAARLGRGRGLFAFAGLLGFAGFASIDDVKALLEPRARKLAGAIAGRALYDGRIDPAAALALIRNARAA